MLVLGEWSEQRMEPYLALPAIVTLGVVRLDIRFMR